MEISIREYAKQKGIAHPQILKDIAAGRIPKTASGKIDPELADAAWARNRASMQESKREGAAKAGQPANQQLPEGMSYADARGKREYVHLQRDAIVLKELQGSLISTEDVKREVGNLLSSAKMRLLAIGNKLAPQLAIESDPAICQKLLDAEVYEALAELAQWEPKAAA